MASRAGTGVPARGEERFFFTMACIMAATVVAGFAFNLAMGRSTFAVPLVYHLHAAAFFGWLALYLAQTGLIASGNVALHRRLGWLSVVWVPAMVALGIAVTITALRRGGGPFFFDANEFLFGNPLGLVAIAGLVAAAVVLRRRTDWHRRLMYCAMASLTAPGFGRLLPMPLFIPWAWEVSNLVPLLFVGVAMVADWRRHGRVHRAWFVGLAVSLGWLVLGEVLAYTPFGYAVTEQVLAGYPGAERPMEAYLPAP